MKTCKHCNKEYTHKFGVFSSSSSSPLYCSKECRKEVRKIVNATYKEKVKRKELEGSELFWILNSRLGKIKQSAKTRNLEFTLTRDEVIPYYKAPCYYCNMPITNINFDRIDNTKGYIADNIVPCCLRCNLMKHNQLQDEFISLCKTIATNHL